MRPVFWLLVSMGLLSCKTVQRRDISRLHSTNTTPAGEICIEGGPDRSPPAVKTAFWASIRASFAQNLKKEAANCSELKAFLNGSMPQADGSAPLIFLNLSGTGLKDNDLNNYLVDIKADLPDCQKAQFVGLDLSSNLLEGKLQLAEADIGSCKLFDKIVYLNISNNKYTADVSLLFSWLTKNAGTLQILDFSNNRFSGRIEKIDSFQSLIYLNAEGNNLSEFKVAMNFPLAYLNFSNQQTGNLAKISLVGSRGISPADRLLSLTHLAMDGAYITGGGDAITDSSGPHTLLFADAISMRRNLPPTGSRKQIRLDSTSIDLRGWSTDLSDAVRITWNGSAWAPGQFAKVYKDDCVADKTCMEPQPLGGCGYYNTLKSLRSILTDATDIANFDSSLTPYARICGN